MGGAGGHGYGISMHCHRPLVCEAVGYSFLRAKQKADAPVAFPFMQSMSALPPEADMCSAPGHVRFVPIADMRHSFDHLAALRGLLA